MGLLDGGLAAVFAAALSGIYLPATVYRPIRTDDGAGSVTVAWSNVTARAQIDSATEAMRQQPGYTGTDVRIIVLSVGVPEVTTDCEINVSGKRYAIANVARDPANAYYDCRGQFLRLEGAVAPPVAPPSPPPITSDIIAGETLGGHRAVMVTAGNLAFYAEPAQGVAVGITTAAAPIGSLVNIAITGIITEPSWSWVEGDIFLSPNGTLTQVVPTVGSIFKMGFSAGGASMVIETDLIAFL